MSKCKLLQPESPWLREHISQQILVEYITTLREFIKHLLETQ